MMLSSALFLVWNNFYSCSQSTTAATQNLHFLQLPYSRIDIGQEINVGSGKFGKNNKHRALNNYLHIQKIVLLPSLIRQ